MNLPIPVFLYYIGGFGLVGCRWTNGKGLVKEESVLVKMENDVFFLEMWVGARGNVARM